MTMANSNYSSGQVRLKNAHQVIRNKSFAFAFGKPVEDFAILVYY